MLFFVFLFVLAGASADYSTRGGAVIPRHVSLLQVHSERMFAPSLELTEGASAHDFSQKHSARVARWQRAQAAAVDKHRAVTDLHVSMLQAQHGEPDNHPNGSVEFHANASTEYQQEIDENSTKCQECSKAEQALIGALQAAQTAHFTAQSKAEAWALATKAHDVAKDAFTTALAAHTASKGQLFSSVITYASSDDDYTTLMSLVEQLHTEAKLAVQAEAWKDANTTLMDTAQSVYDTAAAAALAADQLVEAKRAEEEIACAGYAGLTPTPAPVTTLKPTLLPTPAPTPEAPANLVLNGNFEGGSTEGIPESWRPFAQHSSTVLVTSDFSHSGSKCIKFYGSAIGKHALLESPPMSLKASSEWEVRLWGWSQIAGFVLRTSILGYENEDTFIPHAPADKYMEYHTFAAAKTWEQFQWRFTVNQDEWIRVQVGTHETSGEVFYVDDVELVEVPAAS